ncbi:asparaginase [[Micrococcus luteus] ATCC 49442]|uniref:asparaginase n=1 Tax=[Micrococcus luteus] ATCC 49442 TaxID=2698727 RepID=UPI003297CE5A
MYILYNRFRKSCLPPQGKGELMKKPQIALASMGGTITMTTDGTGGGVKPALDASALVADINGLGDVADLCATTLFTIPGASLSFGQLAEALTWARLAVEEGANGVVLVQGTDTLEETAYFFDLYWDRPEPLVLTGAMRPPQVPGADGPANLLAAVQVAADPSSRSQGVLVVMNDEVHSAARVRKIRASGLGAFSSPSFGPLGQVQEGRVIYGNRTRRPGPLLLPEPSRPMRIALLETHLGDQGDLLQLAVDAGFDGAVVEAFGVGHVSHKLADVISAALPRVPVVFTTRTGAGTTFSGTYGFSGSEGDLLERGVIPAGWLDGRKAAVLLRAVLDAGFDRESIRTEFEVRGSYVGNLVHVE